MQDLWCIRPEKLTLKRRVSFAKCINQAGVQCERHNQRMIPAPLQPVGVTWAHKADAAFGHGFNAVRCMMPDLPVLHPK